jgi:hypothetical protein
VVRICNIATVYRPNGLKAFVSTGTTAGIWQRFVVESRIRRYVVGNVQQCSRNNNSDNYSHVYAYHCDCRPCSTIDSHNILLIRLFMLIIIIIMLCSPHTQVYRPRIIK